MIILFLGSFLIVSFFLLAYIKKVNYLKSENEALTNEVQSLKKALKKEKSIASLLN